MIQTYLRNVTLRIFISSHDEVIWTRFTLTLETTLLSLTGSFIFAWPLNVATNTFEAKYHPFVDPFNKDILNTHSVPDSVLGAADTAMDKASWNYLLPWGFYAKGGGR